MVRRKTLFRQIKAVAHNFDPQAKVILFGSRARGDHQKDSDWDFMVLTEKEVNWNIINDFRNKIYYDIELKNDATLYTTIENIKQWNLGKDTDPLLINIAKEGIEI